MAHRIQHVGSSSLTREGSQTSCIGSRVVLSTELQGEPPNSIIFHVPMSGGSVVLGLSPHTGQFILQNGFWAAHSSGLRV